MLHQVLVSVKKPFIKMVPVPKPECIVGQGKVLDVAKYCQQYSVSKPLVVTDKVLLGLGLLDGMLASLESAGINASIFDEVKPDPDYATVRAGVKQYQANGCDGVIAFGGGSPIDCAKAIAGSVKTKKDVAKLPGLLKIHRPIMPLIAIPTTAGTGSEGTVAAVVCDVESKTKRAITDPFLVPKAAVLDPDIMLGLPPQITAETGVDALTHAIESYLSLYANSETQTMSLNAIKAVFEYLPKAYLDGGDSEAREKMAVASFEAGLAFTRTYIGYVHAIAHQLGAFYHVPHGRANAMVLPHVLKFIEQRDNARLTTLALTLGYKHSEAFIQEVEGLLDALDIPKYVVELQKEDIPALAKQAIKEAFGEYPVPEVMNVQQCQQLLEALLDKGAQ
ncbi:iron-containing alcohol dehydrogenase [Vibrio maritimus]|uniref:iron-containing alcohol dehydrogenase n=1 Tax=Vibrio maritimus TaxID=990268 RepID=UPI001F1ADFA4|nr:iron-containing alcohol dehydrogenase [Vibrio maritimus]